MAKVLVTEHESGARKELDTETGILSGLPAIPIAGVNDAIERLWPKESRGRWHTLGDTTFVLYRVGTRVHFRAGAQDVELGPAVTLAVRFLGNENEVTATRDGAVLLRARYPSQSYRRSDPFLDPWEEDDDLDLVLYAALVAADPSRRQRAFATDDEIRDGEITPDDIVRAVRSSVTARFPRSRAIAIFRELDRWWWRWERTEVGGWGPNCTLCGETPISSTIVGARLEPSLELTMRGRTEGADVGFCEQCLRSACRFLATVTPPGALLRADAALADMSRALRDRGELRDEEIAARLSSMCAAVPAEPVLAPSPHLACTLCSASGRAIVAGRGDARLCAECVAAMRALWRGSCDDWMRKATSKVEDARLESGTHILVLHSAYRLHIPLSPHPEMPVVVSPSELSHWDAPYDDVPLSPASRSLVESQIRVVVRREFKREVEFRD